MDARTSVKLSVMGTAFHRLEYAQAHDEERDVFSQKGIIRWVPYPALKFLDVLIDGFCLLGQDREKKFLDIGCGIGTKVILANVLFEAYGLDICEEYLEMAKALGCEHVFQADCLTFEEYGEFDFLYFYIPFCDKAMQQEFEEAVYKQMKSGALVSPVFYKEASGTLKPILPWGSLPGMTQVGDQLFLKT